MLNILQGHASFGPGIAAHLHIFIATVLQALLLSAAAAVRLSGIRRERDTARAESERLRSLAETDPLTGLLNRRGLVHRARAIMRSAEHTSELQSLMRISYAVFCLQQKNI